MRNFSFTLWMLCFWLVMAIDNYICKGLLQHQHTVDQEGFAATVMLGLYGLVGYLLYEGKK